MDDNLGTSGADARILRMGETEHERLRHRLRLRQTADPAAATVIGDDIADIETRLRASQSFPYLSRNNLA